MDNGTIEIGGAGRRLIKLVPTLKKLGLKKNYDMLT